MSENLLPPAVVEKAVVEMGRLGYRLRLLHETVAGKTKKRRKSTQQQMQQLQAELQKASADNRNLRQRWQETLREKLEVEGQLAEERRYGVWEEIVGLRACLAATSLELRVTTEKLEESRAANDGHELRLAQWLRSFDEAAKGTHEATRMANEWREAAEQANAEVSKLRAQLQRPTTNVVPPPVFQRLHQPWSPTPTAAAEEFHDAIEGVVEEKSTLAVATSVASGPTDGEGAEEVNDQGQAKPYKKRRQRLREEDEARSRLTAEQKYQLDLQREAMMSMSQVVVPASSSIASASSSSASPLASAPAPAAADVSTRTPFPYKIGQIIRGAEVVGVWPQFGAMLELRGAKKWLNNWLPSGTHLKEGDRVDVRIKSIRTENRKVVLELFDTNARTGIYQ